MRIDKATIGEMEQQVAAALKPHMLGEFEVRFIQLSNGHWNISLRREAQTQEVKSFVHIRTIVDSQTPSTRVELPAVHVVAGMPDNLNIEPAFMAGVLFGMTLNYNLADE